MNVQQNVKCNAITDLFGKSEFQEAREQNCAVIFHSYMIHKICETWNHPLRCRSNFSSFPIFAEHGRRGDKLASCIVSTGEKEPLPSRPNDDTCRFTCNFKGRILRPQKGRSFCAISCNTFVDKLFSYGIELSSIRENRSMASWIATQDSM